MTSHSIPITKIIKKKTSALIKFDQISISNNIINDINDDFVCHFL